MFEKDIIHAQIAAKSLIAAIPTVDANGATVDLLGYQTCLLSAYVGTSLDILAAGTLYIELEVEESTDGSTWTDVADADLSDTASGTNTGCFAYIDTAGQDDTLYQTQYKGSARYVRAVLNITGTQTNGTPLTIVSQKFGAATLPAV